MAYKRERPLAWWLKSPRIFEKEKKKQLTLQDTIIQLPSKDHVGGIFFSFRYVYIIQMFVKNIDTKIAEHIKPLGSAEKITY